MAKEITITENTIIKVFTGKREYEIRILNGWIDIWGDNVLIVYPKKQNKISITQTRSKPNALGDL